MACRDGDISGLRFRAFVRRFGHSRGPSSIRNPSLALAASVILWTVTGPTPAAATTVCSPGNSSGTETCGPGAINSGVAYAASGPLTVNVVSGTAITAQGNDAGVLITGSTSSTDATVNTAAGTQINAPQAIGIRIAVGSGGGANIVGSAATVVSNSQISAFLYGIDAGGESTSRVTNNGAILLTAPINSPQSGGYGIFSFANGDVSVVNNGRVAATAVNSAGVGVFAGSSVGSTTVTNTSSGDIAGIAFGINATGGPGPGGSATVMVTNAGNVTSAGTGVFSGSNHNFGGNTIVLNSGTISAGGSGIDTRAGDTAFATNTGMISAGDGIYAQAIKSLVITNSGIISTQGGGGIGNGITAIPFNPGDPNQPRNASIQILNSGQITARINGIFASSLGPIAITNTGTINGGQGSAGGAGIAGAGLSIVNSGTISGGLGNAIDFTGGSNNLTLQAGSSLSGNIHVVGNVTLGETVPTNLSNVISGPGSVIQSNGALTLSGFNTYGGTTTVNGAILDVEGSIASSSLTTVNAVLTGAGTVGNTTIAAGGTLVPGNGTPGSSMTVAGNLAFQSGALYLVQLNPATSTFASVTGTASLNGGVGAAFLSGSYVAKQYTILTAAGGVNGTFGTFNTLNIPAGFKASLSYDANELFLNLDIALAKYSGLNVNQQNVANALTSFFNASGGIPAVFGTLTPQGLTQASGELATASQQTSFDAMNLFLGLLTDPFVAGRGAPAAPSAWAPQFADESDANAYASTGKPRSKGEREAYAAIASKAPMRDTVFDQRWSVWAAGFGGSQTTDGNAALGSNTATSRVFGTAVGADYLFSPRTIAGFALAGGGTTFSVNGLGAGRSDLFQAGAFARHTAGPRIFPRRWPMDGRTSPRIAPSPPPAAVNCAPRSMPTHFPDASKAATAS